MQNRFFPTLFVLLALVAAACGGTAEVATDSADSAETPVEETAEEAVASDSTTVAPTDSTTVAPPDTEPDPNQTTTPAAEATGAVDGQDVYESNCSRCHGLEGEGGRGSVLQGVPAGQPDTSAGIDQVINGGNGMPAFGESLTMEEIVAAVDYIWATF